MAIAFFDLDKTLLADNSGTLWVRREVREGHLSRWRALQAGYYLTRYHLGFASISDVLGRAIASLAGSPALPLKERTRAFYEEEVRHLYRPGALAALAFHRSAGDRRVLLTTSSSYLAAWVVAELELDGALCNEFEVDGSGTHTGRTVKPLCFGAGKLTHATDYARMAGVPLSTCAFYTDSASDLPVLAAVGRPVAVNPDRVLRREALRRGWEVVDWGRPSWPGAAYAEAPSDRAAP